MTKINLNETTDAALWADEFCLLYGGDRELMITWFANALMAGFDEANRRRIPIAYIQKDVLASMHRDGKYGLCAPVPTEGGSTIPLYSF